MVFGYLKNENINSGLFFDNIKSKKSSAYIFFAQQMVLDYKKIYLYTASTNLIYQIAWQILNYM